MTVSVPWTCPNCCAESVTAYCPTCGERLLRPADLTLRGLFKQAAHATTSIDGRMLLSMRRLLARPGALTLAYLQGQRKPFIGPFQLFLIINVFFFAVQSITGGNTLSTPLESHLHYQGWSDYARVLVARHIDAKATTLALYAPIFDQAVDTNAKSLIVLMIPPFALLTALVFHRNRLPLVAHVVFSLHFYSFLLLLFCAGLAVFAIDVKLGGPGLAANGVGLDHVMAIAMLSACTAYLYLATGTVYAVAGAMRLLKALLLSIAVACIVIGYRFVLLPITLLSS